jgi:hypothetical protein
MVEFNFYLDDDDFDRLDAIKQLQGRDKVKFDDFARDLLEKELRRLYPDKPQFDDDGHPTNTACYTGITKAELDELKKKLIFTD